jgi:hypothetical protein
MGENLSAFRRRAKRGIAVIPVADDGIAYPPYASVAI